MLPRISLLFAALGLALATTACSSLTRPDEIQIAAEPLPTPTVRQLPPMPAQGAGAQQAAPHPPGGGG